MSKIEQLDIGMFPVRHSDTGVAEDTNAGVNLLSRRTSNPGMKSYFAKNKKDVSKRFALDAHKLYLYSCATYHASYVRYMLGHLHSESQYLRETAMQVSQLRMKKVFLAYGISGSMSRLLRTCFPFLNLRNMDTELTTTPNSIGLSPRQKVRLFCSRNTLVCAREFHTWIFAVTTTPLL